MRWNMTTNRADSDVWDLFALDLVSIQVEGRIVLINAAGAQMLGAATAEQLVGKPILEFVHPDYREIAAERVREVSTEGIVVCPSQETWLRLDGTRINVQVAAMSVLYKGKPAVQVIVRKDDSGGPFWPAHHWNTAIRSRRKRR